MTDNSAMTDDKLAVSQEARALADELGTITEERHSIVLAALARFEAQARLAGERAGKWQDIASAPKGQGLIDVWTTHNGGERLASAYYDSICGEWRTSRPTGHLHCVKERYVTHWQPLPEPPAILKEAASAQGEEG